MQVSCTELGGGRQGIGAQQNMLLLKSHFLLNCIL